MLTVSQCEVAGRYGDLPYGRVRDTVLRSGAIVPLTVPHEVAGVPMTQLRFEPYPLIAANIGPENPLPMFRAPEHDVHYDFDKLGIPEEDRPGWGWENGFRVLPYRMQDDYDRACEVRDFFSVVLENEHLAVRFLPQIGGLITSILHKATGKQLIACNAVFQPGNVALCNAWIHGGIEWNTAQIGHHYLTCRPLHTARITGIMKEPALRIYAWDRVKCFPYQLDFHLPPDSRFLFVRVRIVNPHDYTMPMYWWSNIGIEDHDGRRIIAPCDTAYRMTEIVNLPVVRGIDETYPANSNRSYDFFFRIPKERRKWMSYIDPDGTGLVHTSTSRLIGRKMFAWGRGPGGSRWNEHLNGPGQKFMEIQAGLARTQMHSVPMPGQTEWTWTEAISYIETDPSVSHSVDWREAYGECERHLDSMLSAEELESLDAQFALVAVKPPEELLCRGLGWGALEKARTKAAGIPSGIPVELPFDESDICEEQQQWLDLLHRGALPERDPQESPGHYMIQPDWVELLEKSIQSGKGDHWLSWLHLGVARVEADDVECGRQAFEESIKRAANGWALRNLAVLALREKDENAAVDLYRKAWETGPKLSRLVIEYGNFLIRLGHYCDLKALLQEVSIEQLNNERVVLLQARLALEEDQLDDVLSLLDRDFAEIREGELSLSEVWFQVHEKRLSAREGVAIDDELKKRVRREFPPPGRIDFRMAVEPGDYVAPQQQSQVLDQDLCVPGMVK